MDAVRWKQIDELVDAALEVPAAEREAFVTARSGDDEDLRTAVIDLLVAQEDAESKFLNQSAMELAAKAMAEDQTEISAFAFVDKMIATYRIEKLLGVGGMGEVYLAFDEKLKRKVALKILPSEFVSNDERVKRFELEARAISSLNHPGIVTIYDVGNFEGINYIATEFVEGKTLRDLMGGRFKIRNIILNSIQLCDALSAAHKEGIIHRDIKPENVMIRRDGYAKILDFGLAKLTDPGQQTLRDMAATSKGVIIGTPAYMSPSQISDESIDHRTDLWSCGVVLYEFLSGKNPFKGANRQETFQAILSKDVPPCSSFNPDVPPEMDAILAKLLEKDPSMGYQSAMDLRADLKRLKREVDSSPSWSHSGSGFAAKAFSGRSKLLLAGVAALSIAVVSILAFYLYTRSGRTTSGVDWTKANSVQLTNQTGTEFFPTLSPDGKDVAYAAEEDGSFDIFVQRVGGKKRDNLTNTPNSDDTQPAFSPNGNVIAFRSEREPAGIYTIEISGDNLKQVSDFGFHPSWSSDGKHIVVSSFGRDQPTVRTGPGMFLSVIDVQTGEKRELLKAEATAPAWSPNGHRIAYWFQSGTLGRREIATIPAGGGEPVVIAKDFAVSNWNPVWSPDGKLLYFISNKLGNMNVWRVEIDEVSGEQKSEPEPVVTYSPFSRHVTFSRDGNRMVYVQTNNQANIQGAGFDLASGKMTGGPFWITEGDREISRAELSADGSQFVMRLIRRTQDDLVTVSRDGKEWRDVTNDEPFDRYVRWSPDGRRLAFTSDRKDGGQVWVSNADGTGLRQLTANINPDYATGFPIWSPDSNSVAVYHNSVTTILDVRNETFGQTVRVLPRSPQFQRLVTWDWSTDGTRIAGVMANGQNRFIGYFDLETDSYVPLVATFDSIPSWAPDGRTIIYSIKNKIYSVDVQTKAVREILHNPKAEIRSPFISRDGKLLYYTAANLESDIWMFDLTPEK